MSAVEALEPKAPAQAGSAPEIALHGLYERHSDRVFAFCLRRLSNRVEAEDAVQNTFLNAFRALQRGVVPLSEKAWLFKIAENACLEAHRTNGRRQEHELGHDPELVDRVAAHERDTETARALRQALGALPTSQRQALLLREWRGLSYREIAAKLGTTVTAVETLIFRARKNVARHLERESGLGRLAGILNLGSVASAIKGVFTGAAAIKLAVAVAVLTLATVPAGDSPVQPVASGARASSGAPAGADPSSSGPVAGAAEGRMHGGRARGAPAGTSPASGGGRGRALRPERPGGDGSDPAAPAPPGQAPGATAPPAPGRPAPPVPDTNAVPTPALPQPPATPPPPALPPPPELPRLDVPQLPSLSPAPRLPQLPQTPELPKLPEVQVPPVPPLPVQPPAVPPLPKLG